MTTLKVKVICGEKTCAKEPRKFCRFLTSTWTGAAPRCGLFGPLLEEEEGWLMRCKECLDAEVDNGPSD